jgi:ankyrin repeat protein
MRIVADQPDVNLSQRNGYGRTALQIAALCGCPNVLKVLLELDHYDINQTDAFGNTLLHLGARIGSVDVCKEVLTYPLFDRNRQNEFGQSALNVADTYDMSRDVCTLLRESGVKYGRAPRVEHLVKDSCVPDARSKREASDRKKALVRGWIYYLYPFSLDSK